MVSRMHPLWINELCQSIPQISFLRLKHVNRLRCLWTHAPVFMKELPISDHKGNHTIPNRIYHEDLKKIHPFWWRKLAAALIPTIWKDSRQDLKSTRPINQNHIGCVFEKIRAISFKSDKHLCWVPRCVLVIIPFIFGDIRGIQTTGPQTTNADCCQQNGTWAPK